MGWFFEIGNQKILKSRNTIRARPTYYRQISSEARRKQLPTPISEKDFSAITRSHL
jgi:hypothetical protein